MNKFLCTLLLAASVVSAQRQRRGDAAPETPPPQGQAPAAAQPQPPRQPPEEKTSKTEHTTHIRGQEIKYTATAGTMNLKKEDGTVTASMFYIAYTRDGVQDAAKRPITYAFNGGPGSSSVWLHLGTLGPKRVLMQASGYPTPPPYKLVDNEYSILDVTDLVFIDPVTTGYSRPAPGQDDKQFHGVNGDMTSVADFIRLYTTRNARWISPKFLAGESYGTTRAANLSGYLQGQQGMNLNGIMLLSSVLNFGTIAFDPGNDLPYILFLPTYTAAAWYHKKLPKDLQGDLQKAIAESKAFAAGEYSAALLKGDTISAAERTQVTQKLARLTGLSATVIERNRLRVPMFRFSKELLHDQGRIIGRYDSRIVGIDEDAGSDRPDYDPSYASVQGAFTATWNQYVRTDLKFESDLPYEILTGRVRPWSYDQFQNRYVNVAETLRDAMTQNRDLRVFVANGYFDLATPFFATEYTFSHMQLDPELRGHVSMDFFDAGHMMYIHLPSLEKVTGDLHRFIESAAPAAPLPTDGGGSGRSAE
jgi:carboxypeptidase C (cathepsin A)